MTGILFLARLGSTRLHNKHLVKVAGRTMFEWLLLRFVKEFKKEIEENKIQLVIATSVKEENKQFELLAANCPVKVFYGSDENIPLRQIECANALHLTEIISIDGDDILTSVSAARKIFDALTLGASLVKTSGLPLGMNCWGYSVDELKKSFANSDSKKIETGWGRIFSTEKIVDIKLGNHLPDSDLRMTLDYKEDEEFFSAVISQYGEKIISVSDDELIEFILSNKLNEINASLQKIYWSNFDSQLKKENEQ